MRFFRKLWLILIMTSFLGAPAPARAQVPSRSFGVGAFGSPFRNFGAFGNFRSFGNFGGFGFPGGFGWSGYGGPFAGVAGFSYNTGSTYFYYPYDSVLIPGFGASEPVRLRATLYPAIAEPSREVILAALEGADEHRARINMRVPVADAKVYLDGVVTGQTGLERAFVTPRLHPGSRYAFNALVVWHDATGQARTLNRHFTVRPGQTSSLDLRAAD
jgi:uncharacterized protein (TIGR03000 family)